MTCDILRIVLRCNWLPVLHTRVRRQLGIAGLRGKRWGHCVGGKGKQGWEKSSVKCACATEDAAAFLTVVAALKDGKIDLAKKKRSHFKER